MGREYLLYYAVCPLWSVVIVLEPDKTSRSAVLRSEIEAVSWLLNFGR